MSIEEATAVVQAILNMLAQGLLTKDQALAAIKRVPQYSQLLGD